MPWHTQAHKWNLKKKNKEFSSLESLSYSNHSLSFLNLSQTFLLMFRRNKTRAQNSLRRTCWWQPPTCCSLGRWPLVPPSAIPSCSWWDTRKCSVRNCPHSQAPGTQVMVPEDRTCREMEMSTEFRVPQAVRELPIIVQGIVKGKTRPVYGACYFYHVPCPQSWGAIEGPWAGKTWLNLHLFIYLLTFIWDRVLLCSPSWPATHCIAGL